MVSRPLIAQGYSLAEEVANSISHGIGTVFGIVGLVLLLVQAVDTNASAMAITSYSLYGGSMILLFLGLNAVSRYSASTGEDMAQEI